MAWEKKDGKQENKDRKRRKRGLLQPRQLVTGFFVLFLQTAGMEADGRRAVRAPLQCRLLPRHFSYPQFIHIVIHREYALGRAKS